VRIERIETVVLTCPWGPPEDGVTRTWPIHRVVADDGTVGIGRGGNPDLVAREFGPLLVGEDPRRIGRLWQRMYDAAWRFRGPGRGAMPTIGALDVALWDLYGKVCGEPVWRLLGGVHNRVQAYADGIGYNASMTPEEVADLVRKHVDLGFEAVKFHLTDPDPDAALEKVRLSRAAMGEDRKLMIDVHRMWDGHLAAEMARKFAPYGLFWIEEPVRLDDEVGFLRMVREATDALVAGGESEGTLGGVRRLLVEGGLQVVQSDILVGGGFTGLMRVAALAEAHNAYVAPHGASYPELICHLMAAVPNGLMVPACPHTEPYQIWSRLYDPPFRIEAGEIEMSDRPGLGLEFDEGFVAEYGEVQLV
jgi:L-alanine-DL-glutamate epimerase-like enolase superfamily enzyme